MENIQIRKINIGNFKEYNTFIISQEEYLKSREERITYLEKCGISKDVLEESIPVKYREIPEYI